MSQTSGVALQPWKSLALERHRLGGGGSIRRSLLVLNYLDNGTREFDDVAEVINAKATTVDRVLNAPAVADALGIRISRKNRSVEFSNGDELGGRRLLRTLITAMARPEFTFSTIRDREGRDAFVRSFAKGEPANETDTGGLQSRATPKVPSKSPTRLSESIRPTLAPRAGPRTFNVTGKRLNKLYRECREIRLQGNENAAALLLRVFLELSSEALLREKQTPLPAALASKRTDWSEVGIRLYDKINAVMPQIDTSVRTKADLKKARVALANPHSSGSIDTLHAYFHNLEMNPSIPDLREAWDAWENYLRLLHAARN